MKNNAIKLIQPFAHFLPGSLSHILNWEIKAY